MGLRFRCQNFTHTHVLVGQCAERQADLVVDEKRSNVWNASANVCYFIPWLTTTLKKSMSTETSQKSLSVVAHRSPIITMKNVSINASAAVSFDGDQESMENPTVDYYFNDFLPPHHEHMDLETESMANKNHQFDPEVNLMSLNWERPTPSYMLSDCFFEIDTTLDGVVDGALEPTEVSEDEMDSDSSSSLEHRFEETAKRLAEYMKKSRQSRLSLTLNSPAVAQYPRKKSISNVVISVEESSQQILTTFGGFRSSTPSSNL